MIEKADVLHLYWWVCTIIQIDITCRQCICFSVTKFTLSFCTYLFCFFPSRATLGEANFYLGKAEYKSLSIYYMSKQGFLFFFPSSTTKLLVNFHFSGLCLSVSMCSLILVQIIEDNLLNRLRQHWKKLTQYFFPELKFFHKPLWYS